MSHPQWNPCARARPTAVATRLLLWQDTQPDFEVKPASARWSKRQAALNRAAVPNPAARAWEPRRRPHADCGTGFDQEIHHRRFASQPRDVEHRHPGVAAILMWALGIYVRAALDEQLHNFGGDHVGAGGVRQAPYARADRAHPRWRHDPAVRGSYLVGEIRHQRQRSAIYVLIEILLHQDVRAFAALLGMAISIPASADALTSAPRSISNCIISGSAAKAA